MKSILISACLLGVCCRYDAQSVTYPKIEELRERFKLIPFCPEIYGGLPTPRIPAERRGDRVVNAHGDDVTENYQRGASEALRIARMMECDVAILKERSPSCGSNYIYDGTFERRLISGVGVTSELLMKNGIRVFSENDIDKV